MTPAEAANVTADAVRAANGSHDNIIQAAGVAARVADDQGTRRQRKTRRSFSTLSSCDTREATHTERLAVQNNRHSAVVKCEAFQMRVKP